MTLQENAPRQPHDLAPPADLRAERIIQIPDEKAAEEHGQTISDHKPHGFEDLGVADVLIVLVFLGRHLDSLLLAGETVFFPRAPPPRAQRHLHGVHAAQDDDNSQDSVRVLVENGVLEVVVVQGNEDSQAREGDGQEETDAGWSRVGERGVAHQTGCVDHRQLIDQLHGVYIRYQSAIGILGVVKWHLHFSVEWNRKLPVPTIR